MAGLLPIQVGPCRFVVSPTVILMIAVLVVPCPSVFVSVVVAPLAFVVPSVSASVAEFVLFESEPVRQRLPQPMTIILVAVPVIALPSAADVSAASASTFVSASPIVHILVRVPVSSLCLSVPVAAAGQHSLRPAMATTIVQLPATEGHSVPRGVSHTTSDSKCNRTCTDPAMYANTLCMPWS